MLPFLIKKKSYISNRFKTIKWIECGFDLIVLLLDHASQTTLILSHFGICVNEVLIFVIMEVLH